MRLGKVVTDATPSIVVETGDGDWRNLTSGALIMTMGNAAAALCAGSVGQIAKSCPAIDLDGLVLMPPVDQNARIFCAGFNFGAHAKESDRDIPKQPTFFARFPSSFVGHDQPIVRPAASTSLDWEGELALMIGRSGRHIPIASAYDHVAGYCPMGEHSVREYQLHGTQATAGKNFDRCGGLGPCIVDKDACPSPSEMEVLTHLNGERMQQGKLSDLIFDIPTLINYISTFTELRPGDIIATGTPPGIGGRMSPPRWLAPGDVISIHIPSIGTLTNRVEDELIPLDLPVRASDPEFLSR